MYRHAPQHRFNEICKHCRRELTLDAITRGASLPGAVVLVFSPGHVGCQAGQERHELCRPVRLVSATC